MPNLAVWMRPKDEKWFQQFFAKHPDIRVFDARTGEVPTEEMDGLLLTGGSDITPEFLPQDDVDPTLLYQDDLDPKRDRWEFEAISKALARGLPILGICRGIQVLNVALGGTLILDIPGHADGFEVEAWCTDDDIIEQVRLRDYPFALAVQYHPERGKIYDALFEDFFSRLGSLKDKAPEG